MALFRCASRTQIRPRCVILFAKALSSVNLQQFGIIEAGFQHRSLTAHQNTASKIHNVTEKATQLWIVCSLLLSNNGLEFAWLGKLVAPVTADACVIRVTVRIAPS